MSPMTRTAVGGPDPNDDWLRLLADQTELWELHATGTAPRHVTIPTSMSSHVIVTADGNLGLWIKLNPFQAAAWHSAIQHAECPTDTPLDDDYDDEDAADAWAYHDMALHYLGEKMSQWLLPMRRAFLELGWDEALLDGPEQ